jgi:threonine/homoserine/homoserine lactone efflux protein
MTYATVVLGLFLIPGPAVLLTLARATAGGRRVGLATGVGIAAGDLVHTVMASLARRSRAAIAECPRSVG